MRVLNAMHRPQDLFDSIENDSIARLFAWMIHCKTAVVRRMPIFCGDYDVEASLQFICDRDDLITVRHRQGAAGQKVILKIYQNKGVHWCLDDVILSEAKNLGSILDECPNENQGCLKAWPHASHFVAALRSTWQSPTSSFTPVAVLGGRSVSIAARITTVRDRRYRDMDQSASRSLEGRY